VRTSRRTVLLFLLPVSLFAAFACITPSQPAAPKAREEITADAFLADVKFLADDQLEGRRTGSPGCEEAARYVAEKFHAAGVQPLGDFGTWYQHFDAVSGRRVEATTAVELNGQPLAAGKEFTVVSGTGTCDARAELFFVGYGLESKSANRHDYAGRDVTGRIVVALTGAPGRAQETGDFTDTKPGGEAVKPRRKVQAAFAAKAAGLILIQTAAADGSGGDVLPTFNEEIGDGLTFPAVHVTEGIGRKLLEGAGLKLDDVVKVLAGGSEMPGSLARPLGGATAKLHVDTAPIHHPTANVVGIVKGDGSHGSEYVAIGAHYDHLGWGDSSSSLAPGVHEIHNGADDNASGTAALMALARWCATRPAKLPRDVVFLAFSGEEMGLLGSQHYCSHPLVPLEQCVAMLNLDMVGRSQNDFCAVGNISSAAPFREIVNAANDAEGIRLKLDLSDGGMSVGSSDHQSFLNAKVPSLFFFSGLHADYHKPTDDADKINADGGARITKLCGGILEEVAALPKKPEFVAPAAPVAPNPHAGGVPVPAPSGEGRPWFGSVPAFGASGDGVLFDGVSAGSPAEKAGLGKGDRLVEWNGRPVKTLEDFTAMLGSAQVGDTVHVVILRGGEKGEKKEYDITLALRR
jgi:hypothetical protein